MMKLFALLTGCVLATILFVYMLTRIDSGGVAMLIGLVFGMLAAVPSVLLLLASSRRNQRPYDVDDYKADYHTIERFDQRQGERALPAYPYQPPVIVLAAPVEDKPQAPNTVPTIYDRQRQVAAQRGGRVFRVVGEREEWDE